MPLWRPEIETFLPGGNIIKPSFTQELDIMLDTISKLWAGWEVKNHNNRVIAMKGGSNNSITANLSNYEELIEWGTEFGGRNKRLLEQTYQEQISGQKQFRHLVFGKFTEFMK